jgi:hypothetical protein
MWNMYDTSGNCMTGCVTNYGQMNLMNGLRKLWEEHVVWTRLFIISALAELPDLEATTKRLLRNPSDFADVLRVYYGRQKADQFHSLLEEHLKIGASVVESAKRQDAKAMEQYSKLWYSNADRIAAFLAAINPYWRESDWRDLLHDHLRMTTDEASARLAGNYEKDGIIFDMIEEQALAMADVMWAGIQRQFNI